MGNPSHPIGLRLTHYRKWSTSWITPSVNTKNTIGWKSVNNNHENSVHLASVVAHRGGNLHGGREERLTSLIRRVVRALPVADQPKKQPGLGIENFDQKQKGRSKSTGTSTGDLVSPATRIGVIRPIDLQIRVGAGGHISLLFYYVRQFEGI